MLTGLIGLGLLSRAVAGADEVTAPEDELYGARASMEPAGIAVEFSAGAEGLPRAVEFDSFSSAACDAFSLEAAFDGEVVQVALVAREAMRIVSAKTVLRHAFAGDELVLLNGYQSWTDTVERSPWSRMRGLRGVPLPMVERFALDALGDYRFVEYPASRGVQHGFTYATFRRGAGMVLVGSLDESAGFTLIRTDAAKGAVTLETECPLAEISPGQRVILGHYAIVRGTREACFDRWCELANITARPVRPLVGYSSWYRHYGDIDEGKLLSDLDGVASSLLGQPQAGGEGAPRRGGGAEGAHVAADDGKPASEVPTAELLSRAERVFQIDDGYSKVGDWLRVDERKFPCGLAPLARRIREAGFVPGLWVAPFVCEEDSRLFRECDDWLLRDEAGRLVRTGSHWSGGFALDTRNVEVRSYVLDVLRTMTQEWGFGLIKADFLYAACLVSHDGLNRGELMADAMALLRKGVGDALLLGCGVPLASAFGVVDYCRIGCDVGLDWDDKPPMHALHRERPSTRNSLGNTYGRAALDGRMFGNDPDVFFLREDVNLTEDQRDELLFADADLGSVLFTSDDMGAWDDAQKARYEAALRVFLTRKGTSR